MKKTMIIIFAMILGTIAINAQEKIASKTYLYGSIKGNIGGKVAVIYGFDDPKGAQQAIKQFQKEGINAVLWSSLFIPGRNYTPEEVTETLKSNAISSVILIKTNGTSEYLQSFGYAQSTSGGGAIGSSQTGSVVGTVGLIVEFYTSKDNFANPVASINAEAKNNWGVAGSERGRINKILGKIIPEIRIRA